MDLQSLIIGKIWFDLHLSIFPCFFIHCLLKMNIMTQKQETVWEYLFDKQLGIYADNTYQNPVLCTEPPLNSKKNREWITQLMFEKFNVTAFYLMIDVVGALYATGRTTGCVLDVGDTCTNVVPVLEGYSLPHAILQEKFGGRDIDQYLVKLRADDGVTAKIVKYSLFRVL